MEVGRGNVLQVEAKKLDKLEGFGGKDSENSSGAEVVWILSGVKEGRGKGKGAGKKRGKER